METPDLKNYEIAFLIKNESGVPDLLKLMKQYGAEISFEGQLRKIALAYKIKNETQAYFGYFHFTMSPEKIKTFDKDLKSNPMVVRSLIITPPFVKASEPAARTKKETVEYKEYKAAPLSPKSALPLSNEELEKKIDEILQ